MEWESGERRARGVRERGRDEERREQLYTQ